MLELSSHYQGCYHRIGGTGVPEDPFLDNHSLGLFATILLIISPAEKPHRGSWILPVMENFTGKSTLTTFQIRGVH